MTESAKAWIQRNLPMIVVVLFAVIALLYLGDDIVEKRGSRISIVPILPEVEAEDPRQGSEEGVVIIEFGDFNCAVCREQVAVLKELINDYPNQVLLVWKDAPLDPLKPESKKASIAAHCAGQQQKFWEMHDVLYEHQDELGRELYVSLAGDLTLDIDAFTACIDGGETVETVDQNIKSANDAQVAATPTFFIAGERYEGYMEYDDFISALVSL